MNYSLRTKSNGFTAWANLRLQSVDHQIMENALADFLEGFNLKMLVESMTGRPFRRLKTFEGLTLTQKETRIQWVVDELQACEIIDVKANVNARLVACKMADEVFALFWLMICYDIEFLWLRSDFLQRNDDKALSSFPLSCNPPAVMAAAQEVDLMSQLASKKNSEKLTSKELVMERDAKMISLIKREQKVPAPAACILNLINAHLQMTREGRKLKCVSNFKELVDSRVLCALVNSIVPNTFTSDVLLNDRWTVNLALQTMAEMSRCSNPFFAEDLVQADTTAVCAYFTFFFFSGYKLRQSQAVVNRYDHLKMLQLKLQEQISKMPTVLFKEDDLKQRKKLESHLVEYNNELSGLSGNFDINSCRSWLNDVKAAQQKAWSAISQAIERKYEIITLPVNLTINEVTNSMMIKLSMTDGYGFYELTGKETVAFDRKLIIHNKKTNMFHDCSKVHSGSSRSTARKLLGLSKIKSQDVLATDYPDYTIFLESLSCNKMLKAGSLFLYQIFPVDIISVSQQMLFKAIKNAELDTVQKLVCFFQSDPAFVSGTHGDTKTTPLHCACKYGQFKIVLYLLEQNAAVNVQNCRGCTPLFVATEHGWKDICKLLIEWSADLYIRNRSSITVLDLIRHDDFREFLENLYKYWQSVLPRVISGKVDVLNEIVQNHASGKQTLASLRSRCINGSTLLHAAAYYSEIESIKTLLSLGVDVNVRDHKQATALHRVRTVEAAELLIDQNADLLLVDCDQNTVLHVQCYGEPGKQTNVECIKLFVKKGVDLCSRNSKGLMPIHCGAIQGRIKVIQTLTELDTEQKILSALNTENDLVPPSIVYLALANDHLDCAAWLISHGFYMKLKEGERLIEKILMDHCHCEDPASIVSFLFENGASPEVLYPGGNSAVHLSASRVDMLDVLRLCMTYGCDVNQRNEDQCTPLFYAVLSNNLHGVDLLLKHGADIYQKNLHGNCAFDLIKDYDTWIRSKIFDNATVEVFNAFRMKETRDLVRAITRKVKMVNVEIR